MHALDFVSLYVEGAESLAIGGMALGTRLEIGVLLVEVRADGQRAELLATLLGLGLTYASLASDILPSQ